MERDKFQHFPLYIFLLIENKDGQLISGPSSSHVGFYNTVYSVTLYIHLMAAMLIFVKLVALLNCVNRARSSCDGVTKLQLS